MAVRRKREKHKIKIRNSTKSMLILILILIVCALAVKIYKTLFISSVDEKEIAFYTSENTFKEQYEVTLKENKYIEEEELKENQPYVTELLKSIKFKFNYNYNGEKAERVKATYKVKGFLKSTYALNGKEEEIWNKEYIFLEEKEKSSIGNTISVGEDFTIDIEKFNELVNSFTEEMKMALDSKLHIVFDVNVIAYVGSQEIKENYENETIITVGNKITKIDGKFDDSKKNIKTQKIETSVTHNNIEIAIYVAGVVVAIYFIIIIQKNTKTINVVTNIFKQELSQILSAYGDKIVKIDSKVDTNGLNIINVTDINELIKLSDETYKPILYYNFINMKKAYFYIILENAVYRYVLE